MTNIQHVFRVLNDDFPNSFIKVNGIEEVEEHYRPKGREGNHLKIDIT